MSLRNLQGVTLRGPNASHGVGRVRRLGSDAEAPFDVTSSQVAVQESSTWISVRLVQQALHTARTENGSVPSPGAVDGQWGPRTQAAFEAYLALPNTPPVRSQVEIEQGSGNADDHIKLPDALVSDVRVRASFYSALPTGRDAPVQGRPTVDVLDPDTGAVLATSQPTSVTIARRMRLPWWSLALIVVAAIGVGIGVYFWWKKHHRR